MTNSLWQLAHYQITYLCALFSVCIITVSYWVTRIIVHYMTQMPRKNSVAYITGPLREKSTSNQWIPFTEDLYYVP